MHRPGTSGPELQRKVRLEGAGRSAAGVAAARRRVCHGRVHNKARARLTRETSKPDSLSHQRVRRHQERDRGTGIVPGRLMERRRMDADRGFAPSRPSAWPWRNGAPRSGGNTPAGLRPRCRRQTPTAAQARRAGSGRWRSRAASHLIVSRNSGVRDSRSHPRSLNPRRRNPEMKPYPLLLPLLLSVIIKISVGIAPANLT